MKKSNYNMLIPYKDNETIIFNPLYGTLGKLEDKIVNDYNNDTLSEEDKNTLYTKHVFIDDNINELDIINTGRENGITNPRKKTYRIWTTSACNARCYYCFELGVKAETMTTETAIKVADYIVSNIKSGDIVTLEWFGGEPLLNTTIIETISDKVINKCKQVVNAKYDSFIITNGSLIDEQVCRLFERCKINRCQITLDGNKATYNAAKNYYNKEDHNYDKVISNIKLLSSYGINTSIRINYDNKNHESISELIDHLYEEFNGNKHVRAYIYPIWSSTIKDGFTSEAHADNNYLKIVDKMVEKKMMEPNRVIGLRRKTQQCAARNINSIAIMPNGNFTKCSETFNQIIGNINDGITDMKTYNEWTSIKIHEDCKDCKYLPVCNDGCQSSRYTRMESCFPTKDIYENIVRWYVDYLDTHKK